MSQIGSGDMVLIGARPGHGKTLLGFELTALAEKINRTGYVFTLDYNEADVWDRIEKLGFDPKGFDLAFELSSGGLPNIDDIRLPNPVDLSLFDKRCFLHDGKVEIESRT